MSRFKRLKQFAKDFSEETIWETRNYSHGFLNGLFYAIGILEGKNPEHFDQPEIETVTDRVSGIGRFWINSNIPSVRKNHRPNPKDVEVLVMMPDGNLLKLTDVYSIEPGPITVDGYMTAKIEVHLGGYGMPETTFKIEADNIVISPGPSWRDHIKPGDHHTILSEYDDGSAVCLSSYGGGASAEGAYGTVSLSRHLSDGTVAFRDFIAINDWHDNPV